MVINYYGLSYFKIETKNAILALNPFSKDEELKIEKVPKFKADICLISKDDKRFNNFKVLEGNPLILKEPGEYEIKDIFIKGITDFRLDSLNTIFEIKAEGITLLNLGVLKNPKLTDEILSKISELDVLIISIGKETLDSKEAVSIINSLEPKIIIPISLSSGLKEKTEELSNFIKEISLKVETLDRLSIKKNDLSIDEQKIVILNH
ncbi:MAG TPA: MBL fold metallo-hydrolase [Candidatus Paceibacterota bacterium]|nr:MBL fold metallo-hydrolase [Candidatus Paceibacterota bacterium]